jgi:hypothetical protein
MRVAGGDFVSIVEAIASTHDAQPVIHSGRRRRRQLIELMADVIQQRGLGDLRQQPGGGD